MSPIKDDINESIKSKSGWDILFLRLPNFFEFLQFVKFLQKNLKNLREFLKKHKDPKKKLKTPKSSINIKISFKNRKTRCKTIRAIEKKIGTHSCSVVHTKSCSSYFNNASWNILFYCYCFTFSYFLSIVITFPSLLVWDFILLIEIMNFVEISFWPTLLFVCTSFHSLPQSLDINRLKLLCFGKLNSFYSCWSMEES